MCELCTFQIVYIHCPLYEKNVTFKDRKFKIVKTAISSAPT